MGLLLVEQESLEDPGCGGRIVRIGIGSARGVAGVLLAEIEAELVALAGEAVAQAGGDLAGGGSEFRPRGAVRQLAGRGRGGVGLDTLGDPGLDVDPEVARLAAQPGLGIEVVVR